MKSDRNPEADEVCAGFDAIVETFRSPTSGGVWLLPILAARVP